MSALPRLIGIDDHRRLSSGSGSGSEHSADECLSEMVADFLEDHHGCWSTSPAGDFSGAAELDIAAAAIDCTEAVDEIRRLVSVNGGDVEPYRELLVGNVVEGAEMAAACSSDGGVSRRRLMMILREFHHNAAICKTKWGSSRGVAAGDHEFIDVIHENMRYLIDTNFSMHFEIARPTIEYTELLKFMPLIFIGTPEELKKIVRIMCDAAKRSLKCTNLSVPPWRKNSYMQKKWLGSYRRTVNLIFDKSPASENSTRWPVKCRWIGFFDASASAMEVNRGASVCVRSIKAI